MFWLIVYDCGFYKCHTMKPWQNVGVLHDSEWKVKLYLKKCSLLVLSCSCRVCKEWSWRGVSKNETNVSCMLLWHTLNDCFVCFQSFLLTCSLGSQWSCWEWWHCVVNQNLSQSRIIFSCKNKKTNPGTCGGALECWQSNIYAVLNYLCTPVLPWFSQPKNKRTAVWFISTDRVYLSHTRSLWSLEESEDQKGLGLGGKLAKAHLFLCGVPGCGHLWCHQPDQELAPIELCSYYVFL